MGCIAYGLVFALGLTPLVMVTGSMGHTIPPGSLVVDRSAPPSTLKVGDMISFEKPLGAHGLDTHRIVAIKRSQGHRAYITKGDANQTVDPWTIEFRPQDTAHRVVFSIPHLGWILLYLRNPLVRTAILIAALTTLLTSVIKAMAVPTRRSDTDRGRAP